MPLVTVHRLLSWVGVLWLLPTAAWPAGLVLRAGIPEGLPGYALSAQGELLIESPAKRRTFECIQQGLNVRWEWQALPTRRLLQMVADGRLDLAFPMGFTPERASRLRQSAVAWDNPDVWLSLRPIDPQDRRLRIGARLGSPQEVDHQSEGYARVVGTASYGELARMLQLGMIDAVVVPRSFYVEQGALWPQGVVATPGRARSSGFYLAPLDPKRLAGPLDRAIEACRTPIAGPGP